MAAVCAWTKPLARWGWGAAGGARHGLKRSAKVWACLTIMGFNPMRDRSFRDDRQAHQPIAPAHDRRQDGAPDYERAHWLAVEWLPKYAPELNDIEVVWSDLKARHLAHQTFTDPGVLDQTIHRAVAALNSERTRIPLANQRISA